MPDERAEASTTVDPEAPARRRGQVDSVQPTGGRRPWPSFTLAGCELPATRPWARMQAPARRPGRPPSRVGLALGASEFGAVTTRMGFGMRTPVADLPALPIHGRGRRRRLALLLGLAKAAAAVPGEAEPAAKGRLIESWCSHQPKHRSHSGHHQQPSCHGHPLPACCRAVTRPESPIGEPGGATARLAAHGPGRAGGGGRHALASPWPRQERRQQRRADKPRTPDVSGRRARFSAWAAHRDAGTGPRLGWTGHSSRRNPSLRVTWH
jgi:hypothetical protein